MTITRSLLLTSTVLAVSLGASTAFSALAENGKPNQATLTISGMGAPASSDISLSTGKNQKLTVKSDPSGAFKFSNLGYAPGFPLTFHLSFPGYSLAGGKVLPKNDIDIKLDPMSASAAISGTITRAGSVVVNLNGLTSGATVANDKGLFHLSTQSFKSLADGDGFLVASVINVREQCCPRLVVPAPPLTISFSSSPVAEKETTGRPKDEPEATTPTIPFYAPTEKELSPKGTSPQTPAGKVPYIINRTSSVTTVYASADVAAAVSFPPVKYEQTWVGGFLKLSDQLVQAIGSEALAIGSFIDGQNHLTAMRSLQKLNAQTLTNYQPSDGLCHFGTLSVSLAASDAQAEANKLAFSQALLQRETLRKGTMSASSPGEGDQAKLQNFQKKYCRSVDNNNGLKNFCDGMGATDDRFNHDVDFARTFDVPYTLNVNFTNTAATADEEDVIALFHNLSITGAIDGMTPESLKNNLKADDVQDLRAALAAHDVAQNSYAEMVGQKSLGSGASKNSMLAILTHMGLSNADAKKMIGENPSYFAQMEVLSKKIYQDPAFVANLYDSPTNVDRQKAAMKAVSLMQGWDLRQSLKRREMLLSALLELKIRQKQAMINQSAATIGARSAK